MTCFWDGILAKLPHNVIRVRFKHISQDQPVTREEFIKSIQKEAVKTKDVYWCGEPLNDKLMEEHLEWIHDYNVFTINSGHDCGVCDPFLAQICQLFNTSIIHHFGNHTIKYDNKRCCQNTLTFHSDTGHFW
jgi:hypothetical protein